MTNRKSTKRALFSSVVALLLCFTMLLGTTFAWFTDTASTGVNTIQAGTLQVALQDSEGNSLEGQTLTFVQKNATGETTITNPLWEPNATFITQQFKIVNEGNLYLEYTIVINGIDGDAKLNEVMEWSVIDGAGDAVTMTGTLAPNTASELMNLKGHMKAEATNEYQGLSMTGIGITVYATQVEAEYDSFDNQYDKDATYGGGVISVTPDTVQDALDNAADNTVIQLTAGDYGVLKITPVEGGQTTVLDSTTGYLSRSINGLTIKGANGVKVDGIEVSLEGSNGNTVSLNNIVIDGIDFTGVAEGFVCTHKKATIKNFTMQNCTMTSGGGKDLVKLRWPENVTVTNCEVDGAARLLTTAGAKNVTVTNNTIKNVTKVGINISDEFDGHINSGTIVISNNVYTGTNNTARFIRCAHVDDAKLIITDNQATGYYAATGSDKDYIKITTKDESVTPDVTITGNKYYKDSQKLHISVNGVEYKQSTPDTLN